MFLVDETPYCVWEWDLVKRNLEFLEQIDPKYFEYIAQTHFAEIQGEHAQRAAIALRTNYHQALETFFVLLFAAFQAPDCALAYVQKCTAGQLRRMIRKVQKGGRDLFKKQKLVYLTWRTISDTINLFSYKDDKRTKKTKELFATLWGRFGHAYLDDTSSKEYNSIKHGFRIHAGGFTLAVGIEHKYGVPPPKEEMKVIGGSKFGTSFFAAEAIAGVTEKKYDRNFRVRRHSINWNPENIFHALQLLAMSIQNVISYLKIVNGVDPKTLPFTRPQSSEYFEEPFKRSVGVLNIAIDHTVSKEVTTLLTRDQILERLKVG